MEWMLGQWFVPPSWPHTLEGVNWDWWSTCLAKLLLMSAFRGTIGYCLDVVPGVDFSAASLVLAPRLSSSSVYTRRWRLIPLTMSLQALHPEELVLMTHRAESVGYPQPQDHGLGLPRGWMWVIARQISPSGAPLYMVSILHPLVGRRKGQGIVSWKGGEVMFRSALSRAEKLAFLHLIKLSLRNSQDFTWLRKEKSWRS